MAEEIRDLIDKINQDGIQAAEEKATHIEAHAKQKADEIIASSRLEAERIIAAAQERIQQEEEREKALLAQAGRDLLLSLRNEMNAMLERIIVPDVRQALSPEVLSGLISTIARQYNEGEHENIEVLLTKEDLEVLERHYFSRLKEETKKNIILRPAEEISGGFIISFDSGKSCYDFSDRSLAEYIGTYLKPKLNRILRESMKE
ncbi:MAG: hypothetical protein MUC66_02360 [Methanolinea sp.]|jgi:V/A-type H+-transporting ATPase subunit E|nr:hypothetical protein [Methanolinea sp.]